MGVGVGNKNAIKGLLSDRPVAYHPDLARIVGGVKAAVFLSQLLYWSDRGKRRDGFIWKTQEEWEEETGLTRYEQEGARTKLVDAGLLEEKRMGWPAKMYYRLQFDKLYELVTSYYEGEQGEDSTVCGKPTNRDSMGDSLNAENPQSIECGKPAIFTESTRDDNTHSNNGSTAKANFAMLARVCKTDLDVITPTMRGKLNQLEGLLRNKKEVTPEDIKQFGVWWYRHYWKGKNGDAPRPAQIRDEWGKFESWRRQNDNKEVIRV